MTKSSRSKSASRALRPTLKDVSELANVSAMTVSNVVNKRFGFVGDSTRERVEKAIKELNYYPNATSRRLRSRKEFSVGMLIVDDTPAFLQDAFNTELVAGLSNHLSMHNYSISLQGVGPEHFEDAAIFTTVGMDALCVVGCGSAETRRKNIDFLFGLSRPIVLLQESLEIEDGDIAIINQDDFLGGKLLGSHVLSKRAEKLVFVAPSMEWPAIGARIAGIRSAIDESGGHATLDIIVGQDEEFDKTQIALRNYLREAEFPDAVLGGNDRLGIACLRYLQDEGYKIPDDIMVTGFNGFEDYRYTNPSLTTVISPAMELGQFAGAAILRRLQTGHFLKQYTTFPVRFQLGGSA